MHFVKLQIFLIRIRYALRLALARPASAVEAGRLERFLRQGPARAGPYGDLSGLSDLSYVSEF